LRYVCIHGHFYQPPRENPWLETIELQDSAAPWHDWNERIHAECYGPNARARILDERGRIRRIVDNYARMSFNFGPTLLAWLERHQPETYAAILDADRESRTLHGGRGSALAQAYNHAILPLADRRDKRTQVAWGVRDFERRFGRRPEGMWLPETAVDVDTLEALAEAGLAFTILEPGQAARTRMRGGRWRATGGALDPTMPYEVGLPSGARIAVFFYDGPLSRAIAFERLLASGAELVRRLVSRFDDRREHTQLVHVATDGETYGHHHRFGDMALAWALDRFASGEATLTNYGAFLERHPPTHEATIRERTSWSCAHGVERWRADCGCRLADAGASQAWRGPLREALDWLRGRVATGFEREAGALLADPWAARDDYVSVVLDRTEASRRAFLARHARGGSLREGRPDRSAHRADAELPAAERVRVWKLLELERQTLLAFTSCGWFFDELSGIETVQVLRYAARAVELARDVLGEELEPELLDRLARAPSNDPAYGDGRGVYERLVRPSIVTLERAAAEHAIRSMYEAAVAVPGFEVERVRFDAGEAGTHRWGVGLLRVRSTVTDETRELAVAVLCGDGLDVAAAVAPAAKDGAVVSAFDGARADLARGDVASAKRRIEGLGPRVWGLAALTRDARRAIVERLLARPLAEVAAFERELHARHASTMQALRELRVPLPPAFRDIGRIALEGRIREAIAADPTDLATVERLVLEARSEGVELDEVALGFAWTASLERDARRLRGAPADAQLLGRLAEAVELALALALPVSLWAVENEVYDLARAERSGMESRAHTGDAEARTWLDHLTPLTTHLRLHP
jgi:alpha-amylase/alpha-mannosidase (GH57 family)